jgi:hydroxyacylglutathione hydrolase
MNITIERFVVGPMENNTYVVRDDGKKALIVDPSIECASVIAFCRKEKLSVEAILLTHGHFDHILGIPEIQKAFGMVPVWVHRGDQPMVTTASYNGSNLMGVAFAYNGPLNLFDEGTISIGSFSIQVIHMPGHTPGGAAFLFGTECITGDSLFAGSVGRADLPGGDYDLLIASIREKLMTLPAETVVHAGHGGRTTIGREARLNPFLQ